jgi:hypothetical protein
MIYFLTFHAKPTTEHVDYIETLGAYINCWIESTDIVSAKIIAARTIENLAWKIIDLDDAYEITLADYENKPTGREYYEKALIDKEVYQVHTYEE